MTTPAPITSPWIWDAPDYQGNRIKITVTFNNSTRALTGASVFRDPECVYKRVYIGLGPDGTPDTSPDTILVPDGTTSIPESQLRRNSLATIEDILALQITAGP